MDKLQKYSMDFGKKEKVLNYACQTYQLSRPKKVGTVMALIRECQPATLQKWEEWYFQNACATDKDNTKITNELLHNPCYRLQAIGYRLDYSQLNKLTQPPNSCRVNIVLYVLSNECPNTSCSRQRIC